MVDILVEGLSYQVNLLKKNSLTTPKYFLFQHTTTELLGQPHHVLIPTLSSCSDICANSQRLFRLNAF